MKTPAKSAQNILTLIQTAFEFATREDVQDVAKQLHSFIQNWAEASQQVETVTYNEVIEYFVKQRPNDNRIVKGALMSAPQKNAVKLTWLFLDEQNEAVLKPNRSPYGKQVIAKTIDDDLTDFFDGRSLIIFE